MEWLQKNDATLVDRDGGEVALDALEGKVVAFYFSSNWCGDCTSFTPCTLRELKV
jgi:hypothetical protein